MLDLRGLRRVRVDPVRHRVRRAARRALGRRRPRHAALRAGRPRHGHGRARASPARRSSGGFGNLRRAYGLACDNLVSADVVGADGVTVVTSGDEHPELLWGLRGGGGNFGVVTSMTFRLRPLPEPVLSGTVFFAAEHTAPLLRFYREWTRHLRDDVTTGVLFLGAGHTPELAAVIGAQSRGAGRGCHRRLRGQPAEAQALVRPLRQAAPVLLDLINVLPYADGAAAPDSAYPAGMSAVMDSGYLDEIDDDVIAALGDRHSDMAPGACELHLQHMGGAVGRVARMSTAVPNRNARYFFSALARWGAPPDEATHRAWLDGHQRPGCSRCGSAAPMPACARRRCRASTPTAPSATCGWPR